MALNKDARCSTPDVDVATFFKESIAKVQPSHLLSNEIIYYDIHFWKVVGTNNTGEVDDAKIHLQLDVLNHHFAPGQIAFKLAEIHKIQINDDVLRSLESNDAAEVRKVFGQSVITSNRKPSSLNVYIAPLVSSNAGWATFPWDEPINDGVVVNYTTLPGVKPNSAFARGYTLVHEVGHWLGLLHVWQFGTSLDGDLIHDTELPSNEDSIPAKHNFMNYGDDKSLTHFTPGQYVRMRDFAQTLRSSFATSAPSTPSEASSASSASARQSLTPLPRLSIASLTAPQLKQLYLGFYLIQQRTGNRDSKYLELALVHDQNCMHVNALFLPWHREYMIRFENAISEAFKANGMGEDEADAFRLPYFDASASNASNGVPDALTRPRVTINLGAGDVEVPNPLLSYTLERDVRSTSGTFRRGLVTGRGGTVAELNARWRIAWPGIRDAVARSMTATTFADFLDARRGNAVEHPHDRIHAALGGTPAGGTAAAVIACAMSFVPVAALDPIFWFHHCNIDRLWHEWQKRRNHPAWNVPGGGVGPTDALSPWTSTFNQVNRLLEHPEMITYSAGSFSTPQVSPSARIGHLNVAASFGFADKKYVTVYNLNMTSMHGPFYARLYGKERGESIPRLLDQSYIFRRETPELCENCREHQTLAVPFIVTGNPHTMTVTFVSALDGTEHDASEYGQWEIQVENTLVAR